MRVIRGSCENPLNYAFCELPGALILLFHDPDSKSGSNVGASLSVHWARYFFGVIFITTRFVESEA